MIICMRSFLALLHQPNGIFETDFYFSYTQANSGKGSIREPLMGLSFDINWVYGTGPCLYIGNQQGGISMKWRSQSHREHMKIIKLVRQTLFF